MTDEQVVLAWLRNRGVDVAMAEHHIAGKKSAGPFCLASCRALAVVAAMESGVHFQGLVVDELYQPHRYLAAGSNSKSDEGYGPTPWDALVAMAKDAK